MKKSKTGISIASLTLFLVFAYILGACNSKSVASELGFDCHQTANSEKTAWLKDVKNTFEIAIPSHWKKEFYVDNYESKLYCADTLKELNNTYLLHLGWHAGALTIDSLFTNKVKLAILKKDEGKLIKSKTFRSHNKDCYGVLSQSNNQGIFTHNLQVYLANKNESYYLLDLAVYGHEQIEKRICEALNLFEQAQFLQ